MSNLDKALDFGDKRINGVKIYNQEIEPTDMTEGDFWYDKTSKVMKSYGINGFDLLSNKNISCTISRTDVLSGYGDDDTNWTYAEYAPLNKTNNVNYSNNDIIDTSGTNVFYFIAPMTAKYKLTIEADFETVETDFVGFGISDEKNIHVGTEVDNGSQPVVNVQSFETGNDGVDLIPEFYIINSGSNTGTHRILGQSKTVTLEAGKKYFPIVQSFNPNSTINSMSWTFELL